MRRIVLAAVVVMLMMVPIGGASAASCSAIDGSGRADWGGSGTGSARVVLDGEAVKVNFVYTGSVETGPTTFDIFMDWYFPSGVVSVVEHSETTPIGGAVVEFNASVDVLAGGSGGWTWSGISSSARGLASIQTLSGTLCID